MMLAFMSSSRAAQQTKPPPASPSLSVVHTAESRLPGFVNVEYGRLVLRAGTPRAEQMRRREVPRVDVSAGKYEGRSHAHLVLKHAPMITKLFFYRSS